MLDLTSMISGPVATMMLADQGAEVIKVEPPEGELVRHMGRNPGGLTSVFLSANRSKRSIALDLKNPAGVDVLKRLISTADVFVQNFRRQNIWDSLSAPAVPKCNCIEKIINTPRQ